MPTDYYDQTVEELKDKLHDRDLPVSGNKAELIDRLEADDAASDDEPVKAVTTTKTMAHKPAPAVPDDPQSGVLPRRSQSDGTVEELQGNTWVPVGHLGDED